MRVSELVRINRDDVSEKGLFIKSPKKEKNRLVALAPDTIESIHKYIMGYRPDTDQKALFTGDYGRLTVAMLRKYMKQAGKASGKYRYSWGTLTLHPQQYTPISMDPMCRWK
jgi:integrase